jgi:hypothetical protein
MSLTYALILMGLAGLAGIAIGYVFRWLYGLSQKGSVEVRVKQILIDAREDAKKITAEAEEEGKRKIADAEVELKEKEEKNTRAEERVFKREEALERKQGELDREIEGVKARIEEIKAIKERAEGLILQRQEELARVAGLSKDEAKNLLMAELEKESSEELDAVTFVYAANNVFMLVRLPNRMSLPQILVPLMAEPLLIPPVVSLPYMTSNVEPFARVNFLAWSVLLTKTLLL